MKKIITHSVVILTRITIGEFIIVLSGTIIQPLLISTANINFTIFNLQIHHLQYQPNILTHENFLISHTALSPNASREFKSQILNALKAIDFKQNSVPYYVILVLTGVPLVALVNKRSVAVVRTQSGS